MKILVIVESPAKVGKISKILNSQSDGNQYRVSATVGHILDLNKEKTIGVDLENNYAPDYVPHPLKRDVIAKLRKLKRETDQVWIASDLDQEGEFIGYSICHLLNLPLRRTKRIIFNEITQTAILRAVQNPTVLNYDLLDAQKTRRIADRLIGFLISPVARSINNKLSVGRVQTIMVKLVIDKEQEIAKFKQSLSYQTSGKFGQPNSLRAKLNYAFKEKDEVKQFLEDCGRPSTYFRVKGKSDRISKNNPSAPLITSTLQSLVSRSMGISPKKVLEIAQFLYQKGVISYPRTDCPKLPQEKMNECEKYIVDKYSKEYHQARVFNSKDKSAQEAHSCIYPTEIKKVNLPSGEFTASQQKVYHYIWLYTVGSQMPPSETRITQVEIEVVNRESQQPIRKEVFRAEHPELIFEGYQKIWGKTAETTSLDQIDNESDDGSPDSNAKTKIILQLKPGEELPMVEITSQQRVSTGPQPYNESSLVAQMKKIGVGRPSTLGEILSRVMDSKGFLYKDTKPGQKVSLTELKLLNGETKISEKQLESSLPSYRNCLYSTELGREINKFVDQYFSNIFNYQFTGELESKMKLIEQGEQRWVVVIDQLYKSFAPKLDQFPKWGKTDPNSSSTFSRKPKRQIGEYQGKPVFCYLGKFGAVIQVGDKEGEIVYHKLPDEFEIDTVKLEQVEQLFQIPRALGQLSDGRKVTLKRSKYGLYLDCGGKNYLVKEEMFQDFAESSSMESQLEKLSLDLIQTTIDQTEENRKVLRKVDNLEIRNGPYGPYFSYRQTFVGIPEGTKIEELTKEKMVQLYENKIKWKKSQSNQRGKANKPKISLKKK